MSDRFVALARLALTVALAAFVLFSVASAPPGPEDRVQAIGRQVKCPVCSGESIADSPAQLARDMMTMVSDLVDEGLSDDQVIDEVLAAYGGDAQRLDPQFSARTLALWLIPTLVLAGGLGIVASRRRQTEPEPGVSVETASSEGNAP